MESKTHWKKLHNPDYLGAYSVPPGKDLIAKIKSVKKEEITTQRGKEIKSVIRFENQKPLIVNATNFKAIAKALKSSYVEDWIGKHIALYATLTEAYGEKNVEAIRVRPIAPKLEKDTLTPERFEAMKKAIASGQFSVEAAKEKFALTPDQLAILEGGGMYKPKYRFDIIQGTPEWTELAAPRLGGSTAHVLLVNGKKREDKLGQTAVSVALENAGIILFNEYPPSFTSDAMQHGIDMEPYARDAYQKETFSEVKECGYIEYGPYLGYSPDGLVGEDGLTEMKCRSAKEFLRYKLTRAIPSESYAQMQWGLAVTGRQWCDYVNWHEEGGIIIDRVERDESLIAKMLDKSAAYVALLESILHLYPRLLRDKAVR